MGAVTLGSLLISLISPNFTMGNLSSNTVLYADAARVSNVNSPAYQPYSLNAPVVLLVNGKPQVSLSWGASVSGVTYSVNRKSPQTTVWPTIAQGISSQRYVDTAVSAGTYSYQIVATNSLGSGWSSIQSVTVPIFTPVSPTSTPTPTSIQTPIAGPVISAVTVTNVTNTSATINWTLNQLATGQVEYGTTNAYGKTSIKETSFNYSAHRQPLLGLTAGALYHYRVRSTNQAGLESISDDYTFTTIAGTVPTTTPTPTPTPAPAPTPVVVSGSSAINGVTNRLVWGAYVGSGQIASGFESLVGHKMDMQAVFVGWGNGADFPSGYGTKERGETLFVYWEQFGTTLDAIINGSQDSYIKQFAASANAYVAPVILAPFHEMNGDWTPWSGVVGNNTPAKVVLAWQHIHDLFAGVNNVKFAWVANADSVPDTSANAIGQYWPGTSYVDYVGLDGFNGPTYDSSLSFDSLFSSAISQVNGYGKPILITSTAAASSAGKPAWITDALTVAIKKYSNVIGWIWFNENKEANWLVNSDASSLTAFKSAIPN